MATAIPCTSLSIRCVFQGYQRFSYRAAHWLWLQGRQSLALSCRPRHALFVSTSIPARFRQGIFIDLAPGWGRRDCLVEDVVSILHCVTLGAPQERGDRHPKVRRGVLLGAGAKVLGNIEIGACAKIAAGSVVLEPVPAGCTAAGVPARIIGCVDVPEPAQEMDQRI